MTKQTSIYDFIGPLLPPNSGDEANLTKWGWPSPALIERHTKPTLPVWQPATPNEEPPF